MSSHSELIGATRLFSGMSKRSLEKVTALSTEVDHAAGHVIVTEGSTAHALHVIVEGTAEVLVGDEVVAEVGPGTTVGEIAILDAGPRTATVRAKTPLKVLAITNSGFKQVLQDDTEFAYALIKHLAGLVRELDAQLAEKA